METSETDKPKVSKGEIHKKHEKAEDMEGRAKLKRNCQQPAAVRTQGRGVASTSLLSIREVAKRNEH